ncbi:hypothetical protein U746_0923 [Mycolicibacterium mucogenicum 261Sha1.1M5]|nr:hypothetical protein U746_0923 [Mycolicibacterium mucogenicum 261Sha1.1M5]
MSVVSSVALAAQSLVADAVIALAAKDGETFDPDKVTPGPEGFIATAVFAAAVILLGFLLVKRLRRNSYRHEIREDIAAELAEAGTADDAGATGSAPEETQRSEGSGDSGSRGTGA